MRDRDSRHKHVHDDTGHPDDMPHHGHISESYGQRYPPGASSVESDYDRGIQTEVETHRDYLKNQQEVFGDSLPSIHHDKAEILINATTELLHTTKKLYRLERAKLPLGRSYTFNLSVAATGGVNHIDFYHQESQYQRWASGISINVPARRLTSLQVFNDGAGAIAFQTNTPINSYEATCTLTSGTNQALTYMWPVIESVNLVSTSGSANVRLLVTY